METEQHTSTPSQAMCLLLLSFSPFPRLHIRHGCIGLFYHLVNYRACIGRPTGRAQLTSAVKGKRLFGGAL